MQDKVVSFVNIPGLVFLIIIMIPNCIYAAKCPEGFAGKWKNRIVEGLEQVGRFGSFACMAVNIPGTVLGFESHASFLFCGIMLRSVFSFQCTSYPL